jgi:guanylate kinase
MRSDEGFEPMKQDLSLVLLLSGPAGTGKTTLCERLVASEANVKRVVTSTTRAPRPGEVDGRDYFFFSDEAFDAAIAAGDFLEWARVHNNRYGTLRREVEQILARHCDVILNVDVQGAAEFRKAAAAYPALARRLVTIFIMPAGFDTLRERLRGRGASEEDIERRMATAEREVAAWRNFDFCFVSADRDTDYSNLLHIWRSQKLCVARLRAHD